MKATPRRLVLSSWMNRAVSYLALFGARASLAYTYTHTDTQYTHTHTHTYTDTQDRQSADREHLAVWKGRAQKPAHTRLELVILNTKTQN